MTIETWLKQLRTAPTLARDEKLKVPKRGVVTLPLPELDALLDLAEAAVRRGHELTPKQEQEAELELFRRVDILKSLVAKRGD